MANLPSHRLRPPRRAFMILIALIAVAMAGLLMVSASPDLSAMAANQRSEELDLALSDLRRAIQSRPLFLVTTTYSFTGAGGPQTQAVGDYWSTEALHARLSELTIAAQVARRSEGNLGQSPSFLTSVPVDPSVPIREWFQPASNPTGLFWGASYNAVRNPTFLSGTALETYSPEAFWIYQPRKNLSGKEEIWRTDRFGQNASLVISFTGANVSDMAVSSDGSRLAFSSDRQGGSDIHAVSEDGSNEAIITDTPGTGSAETHPLWSPQADAMVFRRNNGLPEADALVVCSATGARPTLITTGSWPGMDVSETYDWSPDRRFIAYAYIRNPMASHRIAVADLVSGSHLIPPDGISGPECSGVCNLAFSPDGADLMFGTPDTSSDGKGARELSVLANLRAYPSGSATELIADQDEGPYRTALWLPTSTRPAVNVTARWIVFQSSGNRGPKPYVARKAARADAPVPAPLSSVPTALGSLSISQFGSHVTYRDADGDRTFLARIDGSSETVVSRAGAERIVAPCRFGTSRDPWVIPASNAQRIDSSNRASFDRNAWRGLVNRFTQFEGDHRYGSTYLRVLPPGRQRHFLLDNGLDTFMMADASEQRGKRQRTLRTFLGKVSPTWSPRGLTFIGRKSRPAAGEPPVECFKEAVDVSATTVLITTGFDPALSPDDRWVAVSKAMSPITSDAPARTSYPVLDMDLWMANSVGAPEPVPVHLTPDTPNSQERSPSWSPDGRYIYYQRETQEPNTFLGNHNSTIWRITNSGGSATEVVGNSQCPAFWNDGAAFRSRVELYGPAVSPDGARLAFVGRERILSTYQGFTSGDVIGEMVYVKDLRSNTEPVLLLRSAHPQNPNQPPGVTDDGDWGFSSLSWNPTGEEIFVVRSLPINTKFPQYTNDSHRKGSMTPDFVATQTELIRVIPKDPGRSEKGTPGRPVGTGLHDPASDNYFILARASEIEDFNGGQIFNATYSAGACAFQRVTSDRPIVQKAGISTDIWYVLSGLCRTSPSAGQEQQGQLMVQILNNRGLLVPHEAGSLTFETGLADIGGASWLPFSCGLRFDADLFSANDVAPYALNLCLYSNCTEVGSWVDFTALKLEKAYDQEKLYPTAFGPDWTVFSSSRDTDPGRPGFHLFER